jgi:hypothetical protein
VRLGVANGDMRVAPGMTAGSAELPMSWRPRLLHIRRRRTFSWRTPLHRPYANLGTLVHLADVLTKVVDVPDAKQALVQAGASGYQFAADDSDQIGIRRRLTSPERDAAPGL